MQGTVVSDKNDKTVTVLVERRSCTRSIKVHHQVEEVLRARRREPLQAGWYRADPWVRSDFKVEVVRSGLWRRSREL